MSRFVGVDWASGCWVIVAVDDDENVEITTEPAFLNVWHEHSAADKILVDIRIGLLEEPSRPCDEKAREFLEDRRSSVFSVPCREAVEARTYDEGKEANDGSLGSQSWGLVPRIREVDVFLKETGGAEDFIFESHPEVCYAQFAKQENVGALGSKQDGDGISARLDLLEEVDSEFGAQVRKFVDERRNGNSEWHYRIQSGRVDDVLDAAVLALTAMRGKEGFEVFPENSGENDTPVIVYPPA